MEEQLAPLRHAAEIKLHGERLRIDPDAHRRQLVRAVEYRVVDQDVAVQAVTASAGWRGPVVVVGRAAVVRLAVCKRMADDEHRTVLLARLILALAWRQVRIA